RPKPDATAGRCGLKPDAADEDGAEEALEPMSIGRRPQSAPLVDDVSRNTCDRSRIDRDERGRLRHESVRNSVVFFRLAGAGRVNQPASLADARSGVPKHFGLRRSELLDRKSTRLNSSHLGIS